MGNVFSLLDQQEEETYSPRYNPYTRYSYDTLTSTEDEATRQSYEQSRYEKSKLGKVKRKELERLELEREYARKLRKQEAIERQRLQNERGKHVASSSSSYHQGKMIMMNNR